MSRHRGRSRPFARTRGIWPRHCGCSRIHHGHTSGLPLIMLHAAKTVAPRVRNRSDWYGRRFITVTGTVEDFA